MLYKFEYQDIEGRGFIISDNSDKFLIEEQNIAEGNFLIFSDKQPEYEESILSPEYLLNVEIRELSQKVEQQDRVIEELMFEIIPSLMGGGA